MVRRKATLTTRSPPSAIPYPLHCAPSAGVDCASHLVPPRPLHRLEPLQHLRVYVGPVPPNGSCFSAFSAFAIGPVALSAGLQVSTPSLSADTSACPDSRPAHRSPFKCYRGFSVPCKWPLPLFPLAYGNAFRLSLFSPAPVSPCASRTRHGLRMRHCSH